MRAGRPKIYKCTSCGKKRDLTLVTALCRPCFRKKARAYVRKNKVRLVKKRRAWALKNRVRLVEYRKDYVRKHPWIKTFIHIYNRLHVKSHMTYSRYGGRGITSSLMIKDLEYLWNRDRAWRLERPSIDRINKNGNYTVPNCRYLELGDNIRRGVKNRKARRSN